MLVLLLGLVVPATGQNPIFIGKVDDVAAVYKKQSAVANNLSLKAVVNHIIPGQKL
jgi:hypothetical protein